MDILVFLLLACCIGYITYLLISNDDEGDPLQRRLRQFGTSKQDLPKEEATKPKSKIFENLIKLLDPLISYFYKNLEMKSIKISLMEAGLPSSDEDIYMFIAQKVVYTVFGIIAAFFLGAGPNITPPCRILLSIIMPLTALKLPDFKIKRKTRIKNDEILYNLPDALDLLTVCVEAGLGLDSAFIRVSQEMARTSPILSKEFGRVSKDIMSGMPRVDSFRNLATRNNVADLRSFVALLIQTDKLGTSIAQSLRVYSDTMRTKRRQRVEKLAAQASVKMVVPLVFFVLPSMFVVLLTPAAIQMMNTFMASPMK